MITLKAKEIARLLNRSPKYVYVLLRRKGLSIMQLDLEKVVDLVCEYRWRKYRLVQPKTRRETRITRKQGVSRITAAKMVDQLFRTLYDNHRRKVDFKCEGCDAPETEGNRFHIHHRDFDHYNMIPNNLMLVCNLCHNKIHNEAWRKAWRGKTKAEFYEAIMPLLKKRRVKQ